MKKHQSVFLGTIHIQVGPKGFWPWIWDFVKGMVQCSLAIIAFWVVVVLVILAAATYVMPHLPTYKPSPPASAEGTTPAH